MQDLKKGVDEKDIVFDKIKDPQLFLVPSTPIFCYSSDKVETIFNEKFKNIRNSKLVKVDGSHHDLIMPS